MFSSSIRKSLSSLLSLMLVLIVATVSQPAFAATTPWDSTSLDPSGELTAPNTTNASTASFTVTTPASPASIDGSNVQIYGFQDPGLGSPVKTQVGNGVLLVDGTFSVFVSASGMVIPTSSVGAQWMTANPPAPASLTVFVNLPSNLVGTISYEFGAGSLIKDSTSTNPYIVIVGSVAGSATYVSSKNYGVQGNQQGGSQTPPGATEAPTYNGPSFASPTKLFSEGDAVSLVGKRMSGIYSVEVNGLTATLSSATETSVTFELPKGLAPGTYDVIVYSSAGKLTQIRALNVRAPKKSFAFTTKSIDNLSPESLDEHKLVASIQDSVLNKARCIVNASSLAEAKLQAEALCAAVQTENQNIDQVVIEPRSTVSGRMVYARVVYGWTQN
jgi:hypothetical protein